MSSIPEQEVQRLRGLLNAHGVALRYVDSAPSTNTSMKELAAAGQLSGPTLMFAEAQPAGRGTRGRQWQMVPGKDLAVTLALPFTQVIKWAQSASAAGSGDVTSAGQPDSRVPLLAAAATFKVLSAVLFDKCSWLLGLRWPNDIVEESGNKICGMLCETSGDWLFVGTGVNVNSGAADRSAEAHGAVSLAELAPASFDRYELAAHLAVAQLAALGSESKVDDWLRWWTRDVTSNSRYRRAGDPQVWTPLVIDRESGGMWMEPETGCVELIMSYNGLERIED